MRIHVNLPQTRPSASTSSSSSSASATMRTQAPAPLTALTPQGELILIELQGSLEIDNPNSSGHQTLGTLTFDPLRPEKPVLMVSHHRLEGKFVQLVRPLAVLEKKLRPRASTSAVLRDETNKRSWEQGEMERKSSKRRTEEVMGSPPRRTRDALDFSSSPPQQPCIPMARGSQLDTVDEQLEEDEGELQTAVYYDVVSVIRRKILFSKRPEPIVKLDTPSIASLS